MSAASGVALLFAAPATSAHATSLTSQQVSISFYTGPIKADPTRNYVYMVDASYNRLLALNTATGVQQYEADIEDGGTAGELAVSIDGTKLYLAESQEDKLLVFSLPSLTPQPSVNLSFSPGSIACGEGGRLFVTENGPYEEYNSIFEVSPTTGSIVQTIPNTSYSLQPIVRTDTDGTHLYFTSTTGSGDFGIFQFALSGATGLTLTNSYSYESDNTEDLEPDEANNRLYLVDGGFPGVTVFNQTTDDASTQWSCSGYYGGGVAFSPQASVVFASSDDDVDIKEFSRADGAPLGSWAVGTDQDELVINSLAATPNGFAVFVMNPNVYPDTPPYILGFISSLGQAITLVPTVNQNLTLPTVPPGQAGQSVTLQASSDSGIAITYTVVSGPATISGNVLTYTGTGTVVVAASQAGTDVFKPTTVQQTITVGQAAQTISPFAVISNVTYGVAPFAVTVPFASSGLPVTLHVKSGPATISGDVVTVTGAGAVTLAADQAGNSGYSAAPEVTTSFLVNKASQTIVAFRTIPSHTATAAPFSITPPISSAGLPVTVTVQSGPATLSGNLLTLTGQGTVVLAADQAGNSNFLAASTVTTSFNVTGVLQKIGAFAPIAARAYTPMPFSIKLPVATSKLPVSVTVLSGPATISGDTVTLTGVGTVELAANQPGNDAFEAAPQVTTQFVVRAAPQTISPLAAIPSQVLGATLTVGTPSASSGLPVTLSILSGPATIAGNVVTPTGLGTVIVVANQPGNADYAAAPEVKTTFFVKLSQTVPPVNVANQTFGEAPFSLPAATSSAGLAATFTVVSGPAKILRDVVTLTGAGTVEIAENQAGNASYAPASEVTASFTVDQAAQTIAAFRPLKSLTFGAVPFLVVPPLSSSKLPVVLSILSGPATITGNKVTVTGVGTVTVAANQAGSVNYLAAPEVTASFTVAPASQTIGRFAAIPTKTTASLPFTVVPPIASSKLPVTLSVKSGPATISDDVVTLTGSGEVVLAADQSGNADFNAAAEVTVSFAVK